MYNRRDRKIKRLREYLQKEDDVSIAFLFGSQARGMATEESDFDIAKIILASEKKKMPKTYQEALYIFAVYIGLAQKDATAFSAFANLRNILTREYLDILYEQIQDFIAESQKFYQRLFKFLKRNL